MRIVIISTEFPPGPGGIGTHAWQLARHLSEPGNEERHQVTVVTPQDYASEAEIAAFNASARPRIDVVRLRPVQPAPVEALFRARVLSRELGRPHRADVLVATGARAAWLAAMVARARRMPWMAVGHGLEFGVGGWERRIARIAYSSANAIVCVSNYTWRRMIEAGVRPRSGTVVPNGADETMFGRFPVSEIEDWRGRLGLRGKQVIVTVGNVTDRKGQEIIVRAMPSVLQTIPDAHYVAIGLPTQADRLTRLASDLGVRHSVSFPGRTEHDSVLGYLNCAEVFAMTSRHTAAGDFEGYGIAVVEAALCGLPAVVSSGSGLSEAVVDGVTGLVVPENDPDATGSALVRLLGNERERSAMGRAAQQRAEREQTWRQRVIAYEKILRSVAATGSADSAVHAAGPGAREAPVLTRAG